MHVLLFCFSLVSLVFLGIFSQRDVLLFSVLFVFLLWLVFVCFSFIFERFFLAFCRRAGASVSCGGAFRRVFSSFFFLVFFFGWSVK